MVSRVPCSRPSVGENFGDVAGQDGATRSARLAADQMTVILDRGAAARGIDDDGIESPW